MSTVDVLASVLPSYITEQNSLIPQLLAAYYTWLESKSPQEITEIRDVRKTQYLDDIVREFVVGITTTENTDIEMLVDNAIELYRMKGTPVGLDTFYRIVYGVEPEITFPRERTFAASASTWHQQYTMETDITDPLIADACIGQIVASATGSARVLSAHFSSTMVAQRCVLTIHDVQGYFQVNQRLLVGTHSFKLVGSLGSFILPAVDASIDSQMLTATSATGSAAKVYARAKPVTTRYIQAKVTNGGSGYSLLPTFRVSNVVIDVDGLSISNADAMLANLSVTQQAFHAEYTYEPDAPIEVGSTITLKAGATTKATANVVALLPSTTLGQRLLLSTSASAANVTGSNNFVFGANTYSNVAFTDDSASGTLVGFSDTFTLTITDQAQAIDLGQSVFQYQNTTLRATGIVVGKPATDQLVIERQSGVFSNTYTLKASANSAVANIATVTNVAGSIGITDVVNQFDQGNALLLTNATASVVQTSNTEGVSLSVTSLIHRETIVGNTAEFDAAADVSVELTDGDLAGQTVRTLVTGSIDSIGVYTQSVPTVAPLVAIESPTMSNSAVVQLTVTNAAGFSVGQEIQQIGGPGVLVTLSPSSNTARLQQGETVYVPSKAAPGFVGVITDFSNTATANEQLVIHQYIGDVDWTTAGWSTIESDRSNVTVTVSSINASASVGAGVKATIIGIDDDVLFATVNHRYQTQWVAPSTVSTSDRFYTANVTAVTYDTSSIPGANASVRLSLAPSQINTHTLNVFDSGQGFINGQVVTLTNDAGVIVGNAIAVVAALGTIPGISTNDRSKLAAGQHLFDGQRYQQYSIDIASSIQPNKYSVNQQFTDIAGFNNLTTPMIKATGNKQPSSLSAQVGTQNV